MLAEAFLTTSLNNLEKNAFYYLDKNKVRTITYYEVLKEVVTLKQYLLNQQYDKTKPVLLFFRPSKLFYITIFTCMFLDIKVVIIDSFKNQKKVLEKLKIVDARTVFVNNHTRHYLKLFSAFKNLKPINVDIDFKNITSDIKTIKNELKVDQNLNNGLITFTSGTSGAPKAVYRDLSSLTKQVEFLNKVDFSKVDIRIILPLLPVYPIFTYLKAIPTFLLFEKNAKISKYINAYKVDAIIASVSEFLKFDGQLPTIKYGFMGGSSLRLSDSEKIIKTFPNATINYIYGATEAVVIARTTLKDYIKHLRSNQICLGNVLDGVNVEVENNELVVKHQALTNDYLNGERKSIHKTGDLGYIENGLIYLLGKASYSTSSRPFNYELETLLSNKFFVASACISVDHKSYYILTTKASLKNKIVNYLKITFPDLKVNVKIIKKFIVDERHHYKYDYQELIKKYKLIN